jgi:hypothetical protein
MIDTNTQTNSTLISLSRAAQLTGYHQDYLGQLCRLGKLSAIKVGRNWFTYPDALNRLTPAQLAEDVLDEQFVESTTQQNLESGLDFAPPEIIQNITVSQVEGLPIAIRTIPAPTRSLNNVQSILTTMRIESLQREVMELRQLLSRLMAEVANHSILLNTRTNANLVDSLKHSYVSNFDFNAPYSRRNLLQDTDEEVAQSPELRWAPVHEPRYSILAIMSGAAVMVAIALLSYSIISGQFFGDTQPQVKTVYYQSSILASEPYTVLQPEVAGDSLTAESIGNEE